MPMVGKTIKWYRNDQGMTQEQLAEGICSPTYISQLENDLIPTNKEILQKICQRLGINENKVLCEVDLALLKKIKDWLKHIHEFDVTNAKDYYNEIEKKINEDTHFDIEYLYELALFGYLLITDQLKSLDQLFNKISKYSELYIESDIYSYYKFVGIYFKRKGKFIDSLKHLKRAEKIIGEGEDPELCLALAIVYSNINMILISNRYARQAFKKFHDKLYYNRILECQIVLNINYSLARDFDSIDSQLERLIEMEDDNITEKTRANIIYHIGIVNIMKKNYNQAIKYLLKVRKLNINQADYLSARYALVHLYLETGETHLLKNEIEEALQIAKEFNQERFIIKFNVFKFSLADNREKLVNYLKEVAIPFFEESGEILELKRDYELMGNTLYDLKRYKSAAEYYRLLNLKHIKLTNY